MLERTVNSSGFKLALRYLVLFTTSVAVLLGFLYWTTLGYMDRQTDQTIEAEIRGLSEQYLEQGFLGLTDLVSKRVSENPDNASVYLLTDANFVPIVGNLRGWPDTVVSTEQWMTFEATADGQPHTFRIRQFRLRGGFHLLVGRDVGDLKRTRGLILRAFVGGIILTIALGLIGGMLMSRGILRRLDKINQTSRAIVAGDLDKRVPTSGSNDEIDELAQHLNQMLERIQSLMMEAKRVSDNIAHDLRTPLSRLLNQLEALELDETLSEVTQSRLRQVSEEANGLLVTFNALLRIARIESQASDEDFKLVSLNKIACDAVEFYEPLCTDNEQTIVLTDLTQASIFGDRDLIFQAITNLIDNAVKYSPTGTRIQVEVEQTPQHTSVSVVDQGAGVSEQHYDNIIKRFFRLDSARTTPGNGLGLSLVRAVAQLHGAQLHFTCNSPGLRATLLFFTPSTNSPKQSSRRARDTAFAESAEFHR